MNVAIFGVDQISQVVANVINKLYNPLLKQFLCDTLNITAFVTRWGVEIPSNAGAVENIAILNPNQFAALYRQKLIDKIIVSRENINEKDIFALQLLNVHFDDIYITNRLNNNINVLKFFEPYISAKFLPYLEFRIADHCNMNCKGCVDFAALVPRPHFANLAKFTRDFERLHEFIDDIRLIRIMGGEPLLNPEVTEYVKLSRKLYPLSYITLVTNGILLPKMSDEFFKVLRETNSSISISLYPPMASKIDSAKKLMDDKNVKYQIITDDNNAPITKFFLNQTLEPHNKEREIFFTCGSGTCHNLWEGKMLPCPRPSAVKYFNDYYKKNLPEDSGIIDLYDENLTTEKLKTFMVTPFELCRYCTPRYWIKWGSVKHPSPISDWVVDDALKEDLIISY